MKNKMFQHAFLFAASLLPVVYILLKWPSIPQTVPTHFDAHFRPNQYSDKTTLLIISAVMALASWFVYFLMLNIRKIDPKRTAKPESQVFNVLGVGVLLFFAALNFVIVISSISQGDIAKYTLMPVIGLLFVFLGAIMPQLQPNYFAGVRIPWTLSSDYNWRKTHQLTGKIWFMDGIAIAVLSILLPAGYASMLIPASLPVIIGIPIIYSFLLFRKEQANPDIAKDNNL